MSSVTASDPTTGSADPVLKRKKLYAVCDFRGSGGSAHPIGGSADPAFIVSSSSRNSNVERHPVFYETRIICKYTTFNPRTMCKHTEALDQMHLGTGSYNRIRGSYIKVQEAL